MKSFKQRAARLPGQKSPAAAQLVAGLPESKQPHQRGPPLPPPARSLSLSLSLSYYPTNSSTVHLFLSRELPEEGRRAGCVRSRLLGDVPGIPIRLPAAWILMTVRHRLITRQQLHSYYHLFSFNKTPHIHFVLTIHEDKKYKMWKIQNMNSDWLTTKFSLVTQFIPLQSYYDKFCQNKYKELFKKWTYLNKLYKYQVYIRSCCKDL